MKAVCSFSGGLDSMLAAKIMVEEGIEVEALYFKTGFGGCGEIENALPVRQRAESLGVKMTVVDVSAELLKIISAPQYGFGKNMNPCMDCHALFFRKCYEYMEKLGASFIVTGEVVGERPMSQRKWAMMEIDRFTGLEGLILRPLSARIMPPTIPEKKGWVNRENLFAISGRSRKPQRLLAQRFGIKSYPNAAGGCLLTEKDFSRKLKDIMEHRSVLTERDIALLRTGRHFRLSPEAKLVIGRDERENERLLKLAARDDIRFATVDVPGPVGVLTGGASERDQQTAASVISSYSDAEHPEEVLVAREYGVSGKKEQSLVKSCPRKKFKKHLI